MVPDILRHIISCYLKALTHSLEHANILNSYVTILLMFLQTILRHPEGLSALKRAISWADLAAFIHHNTRCVVPDILWHIISCYLKALTRSLEHADIPNSYITILLMFLQAILRHPEGLPLLNVPFR